MMLIECLNISKYLTGLDVLLNRAGAQKLHKLPHFKLCFQDMKTSVNFKARVLRLLKDVVLYLSKTKMRIFYTTKLF